jgi:hypothetical protein
MALKRGVFCRPTITGSTNAIIKCALTELIRGLTSILHDAAHGPPENQ